MPEGPPSGENGKLIKFGEFRKRKQELSQKPKVDLENPVIHESVIELGVEVLLEMYGGITKPLANLPFTLKKSSSYFAKMAQEARETTDDLERKRIEIQLKEYRELCKELLERKALLEETISQFLEVLAKYRERFGDEYADRFIKETTIFDWRKVLIQLEKI